MINGSTSCAGRSSRSSTPRRWASRRRASTLFKAESKRADIRRLLGLEGTFGADMGLDADWAARAIKATGNYGEIFERNLGVETPLQISRGINALWNAGGLLYAPPVR
jgi:general L-amino acid transport system substrate-binding protein